MRCFLLSILAFAGALCAGAVEPAKTIPLWPDGVQGAVHDKPPERILPPVPKGRDVQRMEGVTEPSLLYFPAPKEKSVGAAVIVCPGGGFSKLALDLEGTEVAEQLNAWGLTV